MPRLQQQQQHQLSTGSASSFLYRGYADSAADLIEMMRRIVRRGGRGRKQDNVPKEVRGSLCVYSTSIRVGVCAALPPHDMRKVMSAI